MPFSSSPATTLATARLELRPVAPRDLTRLHPLWIDPHIRRFLFDDREIAREEAEALVRASVRDFAERGYGLWLVLEKGRSELAGFAGLLRSDDPSPTLVYGVRAELTGRGYATEAASAVLHYALEVLQLDEVRADVDEPNTASIRVLGKLGMRQVDRRVRDGKPLLYFALHRQYGHGRVRTTMAADTIRFYFDYESPNAYIAWTQLPRLAERYGFSVEPVPVLYAALLDTHGSLGPGEMPAKGRWMWKNLLRKAVLLGISLNPPAFLPFNPLLALRVTLLVADPKQRDELISVLFQTVWVRGLHVSEEAVVARAADEIGLPGAVLLEQARGAEVKQRLRANTDEALSHGMFGVPSMVVGDELFWGYDDFPYLELFLAGKDPVDAREWQKWGRPSPASSMRRRFRE